MATNWEFLSWIFIHLTSDDDGEQRMFSAEFSLASNEEKKEKL